MREATCHAIPWTENMTALLQTTLSRAAYLKLVLGVVDAGRPIDALMRVGSAFPPAMTPMLTGSSGDVIHSVSDHLSVCLSARDCQPSSRHGIDQHQHSPCATKPGVEACS